MDSVQIRKDLLETPLSFQNCIVKWLKLCTNYTFDLYLILKLNIVLLGLLKTQIQHIIIMTELFTKEPFE